jgi:hypothetical protein
MTSAIITLDPDVALEMQVALNRTLSKLDPEYDDADIRLLQPLVVRLYEAQIIARRLDPNAR